MDALKSKATMTKPHSSADTRMEINKMVEKLAEQMKESPSKRRSPSKDVVCKRRDRRRPRSSAPFMRKHSPHNHKHQQHGGRLAKKHSVCVEGLGDADGIVLCVDLRLKNVQRPAGDRSGGGGKVMECGDKKVRMRVEMPDFEPARVIINGVVFQKIE